MKKALIILTISLTSILSLFTKPNASIDNSNVTYNSDDSFTLLFKAVSPDLMVIKHDIEYNSDEFTLKEVKTNSYFNYLDNDSKSLDNKVTKTVLFDSTNAFDSIEYLELTFKPVNDSIKEGTIRIDNIEIANSDHKKLDPPGEILTVKLENNDATVYKEELIIQNVIVKFLREHKKACILVCVGLLILIILDNIVHKTVKKVKENKNYFTDMKNPNSVEEIQNEEGIELIRKVEDEEEENPISDDIFKDKYEVFILLLLVGSLFTFGVVKAEENNIEQINGIRKSLVNNDVYNEEYDLDKDKKITVIDLVYAIAPNEIDNKGTINFK